MRRTVAILTSILLPGFGQFVLGHRREAFLWWICLYAVIPSIVFGALFRLPWIAVLGAITAVVAWVVMLVEVARRPPLPDAIPRWPAAVGVALALLLAQMTVGGLPDLPLTGIYHSVRKYDAALGWHYVYADKLTYRLGKPRRGDIVVFRYPRGSPAGVRAANRRVARRTPRDPGRRSACGRPATRGAIRGTCGGRHSAGTLPLRLRLRADCGPT